MGQKTIEKNKLTKKPTEGQREMEGQMGSLKGQGHGHGQCGKWVNWLGNNNSQQQQVGVKGQTGKKKPLTGGIAADLNLSQWRRLGMNAGMKEGKE
jgi:hypothetical protein